MATLTVSPANQSRLKRFLFHSREGSVPVASPDSLERVRAYADELVYLEAPAGFHAVGQFYRDFDQVEDDEVIALLAQPSPTG